MRVLLIGDYKPLLKALKQGLEEDGFAVEVTGKAEVGSDVAPPADYDVIVLDLKRHEAAEVSLIENWRRAGMTTPVFVLSVPGSSEERQHLDTIADGWLPKPFPLEEFFRQLRILTGRT